LDVFSVPVIDKYLVYVPLSGITTLIDRLAEDQSRLWDFGKREELATIRDQSLANIGTGLVAYWGLLFHICGGIQPSRQSWYNHMAAT